MDTYLLSCQEESYAHVSVGERALNARSNTDALTLKRVSAEDADQLYELIQENRTHLTQNGDYTELVELSRTELKRSLECPNPNEQIYRLVLNNQYIGTVSLIKHEDGVYSLGYWIAESQSGNGYMKRAIRTVIDRAVHKNGVKEIWAGIKPANTASINLVKRLGFVLARTQPTHLSYRLKVETHDTRII